MITMYGVLLFALASAVEYFRNFWGKVDSGIKLRRRNELLAMERQKRRLLRAERKSELRAKTSATTRIKQAGEEPSDSATSIRRSG
jgi:hypothetical protein